MDGEAAELRSQREGIQRGKKKGSKSLCQAVQWNYSGHILRMLKRPLWLVQRMCREENCNGQHLTFAK